MESNRRRPWSILFRAGLDCWTESLVPPPGKAEGYCGSPKDKWVSPWGTMAWARAYCRPAQRCLGAVVDSLHLVSGDIAGPGPGGLGCWADAGPCSVGNGPVWAGQYLRSSMDLGTSRPSPALQDLTKANLWELPCLRPQAAGLAYF